MRTLKLISFALVIVLITGFIQSDPKPKNRYIDRDNMDIMVKPGENFYFYSNGQWLKRNKVPASKTSWGSFGILREESSKRIRLLLERTAAGKSDPKFKRVGDLYKSGMDSAAIERLGYKPIVPHLERIRSIKDADGILNEITYMRTNGLGSALFTFTVAQDRKSVTEYIPQFNQGGITLPDRDYYLKNDVRSNTIRKSYREHLVAMLQLIDFSKAEADAKADAVIRIETALAKAQLSRVEMRDPQKTYNKFSVKDFTATTPGIDWSKMLDRLKVAGVDSVTVNNPGFFKSVEILLGAVSVEDWKAYLEWNVLRSASPYLSNAFVKQNFELARVLTGQKEMTPRWQRTSSLIDQQMADLLGQLYVGDYFKPEAKKRMEVLVANLQQTFNERIQRLDWMTPETKQRALEKLNAFRTKIGYPDVWRTYEGLEITSTDFLGNLQRTSTWSYNEMVARYGKPIDKTRWGMTAPTVNASYNAVNNEICFPAGILQFPFFDFNADDAINYGGIGAVIGHEITHGFDDSGRQYAADGNLKDWWQKEDADKFKELANKVVEQFNGFTVLDTLHVNGKLTLGENLADLGGLAIAYEAFTKTKQFKEGKKIDGFTPQQRFFLGWAQIWRVNVLAEQQAQLIVTDPHSPGLYRCNGPLSNMDEFYDAFGIKEGDKLFKPKTERIKVW